MKWNIENKTVLITGGNSGIGKATALELARRGARVTITARDGTKGMAAAADIATGAGTEVEVEELDLASLDSVRAFAGRFADAHDRLDVLINNAGVMTGKRIETQDGFEWTLAVNHLGPFLLTNLLTELLVASAPARVITVSSENYRRAGGGLNFDDLQMEARFSAGKAYASSKLANILFTVELNRRLRDKGVSAFALHPGVVATSFGKGPEGSKLMGWGMTLIKPILRTPAQGAETPVLLATEDDGALGDDVYWSDGVPKDPLPAATDADAAARLWSISERLVGSTD